LKYETVWFDLEVFIWFSSQMIRSALFRENLYRGLVILNAIHN